MLLQWEQFRAIPADTEITILLDSYSSQCQGKQHNRLYFLITRTDQSTNEGKKLIPKILYPLKEYLLTLNNYTIFSGTLYECKQHASKRATEFLTEFQGEFSFDLLDPQQ